MQLLKYETTSENISSTDAKTMMRVHCKKTSLYANFRLTWAFMCVNLHTGGRVSIQLVTYIPMFHHKYINNETYSCILFDL